VPGLRARTKEEVTMARLLHRIAALLGRLVNDRHPSQKPPPGNFIPNSNGEGGTVISSGDSSGNG
jgi:hypothetical protein